MKLVEAANAYMELNKLHGDPMPVKIAYGIDRAMDKLERPFKFFAEKEDELLKKHPPEKVSGKSVFFATPEERKAYQAEHAELEEIEEEIAVRAVELPIDAPLKISPEGLKILTGLGIVRILGGEDDGNE